MKDKGSPLSLTQLENAIKEHAADRKFKDKVRNILRANEDRLIIETPYKLPAAQVDSLVKQLGLDTLKTLEVEQRIDPDLIAGLVVKFKNHYFDVSLKGSLQEIAESLHM
jgi:F0F1-type ATP synthase delta subunit